MENFNPAPVTIKEWMVTLLLTVIPIVNIIMLFIWSFGSGHNPSKSNWAKATLIWMAILSVFYTIIFLIFGLTLFGNSSDLPNMDF